MMDGATVERIVGLSQKPFSIGELIVHPTDWAVCDPAALVKAGPQAKTIAVSTLGAVRDYITANRDALDVTKLAVHVLSPNTVQILGALDTRSRSREVYLSSTCADLGDGFLGRFWSLEEFLVSLQVRFTDAGDRSRVLALLGNVKHESVKTSLDDGVTQTVQARAGVALVSEMAVPNPVKLSAYRTFRDLEQPTSLFVLRVAGGKSGGLPEAGLFEADGGAWRLTATARIQEWLSSAVPMAAVLA